MSLTHPHTPLEEYPTEEEQAVKMWKPFDITVDEHYRFLPRSRWGARYSYAVKLLASGFFIVFNRLCYGFRVIGRERFKQIPGGAVTICNHVQGMDCSLVVEAVTPHNLFYPTVKTNLELAGIRWLIKFCGGIPIPETPKALRVFNGVIGTVLKRGDYVHVYPEGVLYPYYLKGIRKFYRGAFKYAYDSDVPVMPMVITFRERKGLRKLLNRRPLPQLTVLDPVYPDRSARAHAEIERLMNTCYEAMSDFFDERSIPVPRDADNAEALKAHSRGGKKKHRKGKTADAVVSDPEMCNS